jgi:Spx/MgsR family transcriptional regulator
MKKAFAWLEGKGIEYEFHDYKKLGAPADKVKAWVKQAGWERVLNSKGKTFRDLPASRQSGLDAARAAALMVEFPSAIKRPVIEADKSILVGFDEVEYAAALRKK